MTVAALVFDAYGTLFDVHAVVQRCEGLWPGKGMPLSQLWRAKQLEYTWQRSLMGRYAPFSTVTREALAYACEALGLALDEAKTAALMDEYLRLAPYPDVPGGLAALQAQGRKLAILTNGSPDMIEPLVAHCGMQEPFAAVLSVDPLKRFKPAPEVYALAVERLGVPASSIGFVSSNCWDALGAKSFGFRVWWINRSAAPVDRLGFHPDGVLRGLGDL
ncbi:MAG: haloacid dehalogenase type II, partial [Betaproteobacteria bacterium]|nr:haloacid dehalogenase type II [Betaproteobacteria bacterium]